MKMPLFLKLIRSAVFVAALIVSPSFVLADANGDSVDEVVVTASRLESTQRDLSQSIDILTREEIESLNPANVTELLRRVAGLSVIQQGARGNVTSILMRGGESNFTAVLIDGLKINDSTNTRGGSYDFSFLDLANIERIEIIRGPMSAVHGSDSLAGIINIITRSGKDGSSINAEVGGHGLRSASAVLGGNFGRVDGYLRAHALSEDGDIEGSNYEDVGMDAGLGGILDDKTEWGVGIRYVEADSTGFPEDSGGPIFSVFRDVDARDVTEMHARAHLSRRFNRRWRVSTSLGRYKREEIFVSPGIAPGVFDGVPPNSSDTEFSRTELEASIAYDVSDSASVVFGGEWQREDGSSIGILDIGFPLPTDFRLERDTVSAFAEGKFRWHFALLQASIRRDDPDEIDAETTIQIGAVFDMAGDNTQLRVNWGEGFKAASFFALAHPLVGNPDLLSETAETMDVGIRHRFGRSGAGNIEFSVFRNKFENLIDFDPVLFSNVNRSQVITKGAELAVEFDLSRRVNFGGQISYLDANIENSSARLRGRPSWRFGATIDWTITDKVQLASSFLALDEFWEVSIPTGGMFLDGYERVDLALTYQSSDTLILAFAVDNLLDEHYQEAVGFPAAGVRGRVGVRYGFQ